jgi:hypothetical protein
MSLANGSPIVPILKLILMTCSRSIKMKNMLKMDELGERERERERVLPTNKKLNTNRCYYITK